MVADPPSLTLLIRVAISTILSRVPQVSIHHPYRSRMYADHAANPATAPEPLTSERSFSGEVITNMLGPRNTWRITCSMELALGKRFRRSGEVMRFR